MTLLEEYVELLRPLVSFHSVSTDAAFSAELAKTAAWLGDLFGRQDFAVETWSSASLNPVICARYQVDRDVQTVLVYGHYDVQPAARADGWSSDPFKLTQRNGRLYGRGVVDNKGQVLIHLATVLRLIHSGQLAHNVVFLIEGNEESGSVGLATLLEQHRAALACDQILISDGEIPYRPTIEASLRGGFNLKVRYTTARTNLHSGLYGGGIPNAAQELSRLLAGLYDDQRRVTVPGFYDGLAPLSVAQRAAASSLYVGNERLREITGIKQPVVASGEEFVTAVGWQPTLQVSGIATGYNGEGFANIIPATAEARINVRTAAPQHSATIRELLVTAITARTPDYVDCQIEQDTAYEPIQLPTTAPFVHQVEELLQQAYGIKPIFSACGGSLPIVADLQRILGVSPLLVSLGNDDCNMHGVDENFELGLLNKGLKFSQQFFSQRLN